MNTWRVAETALARVLEMHAPPDTVCTGSVAVAALRRAIRTPEDEVDKQEEGEKGEGEAGKKQEEEEEGGGAGGGGGNGGNGGGGGEKKKEDEAKKAAEKMRKHALAALQACVEIWTRGKMTIKVRDGKDGSGDGSEFLFASFMDDICNTTFEEMRDAAEEIENKAGANLLKDMQKKDNKDKSKSKTNGGVDDADGKEKKSSGGGPRVISSTGHHNRASAAALARSFGGGAPRPKKPKADTGAGGTATVATAGTPGAVPATTTSTSSSAMQLRSLRRELLRVEENVPWAAVRASWIDQRARWRRNVSAIKAFNDAAKCMVDFRRVLIIGDESVTGLCRQEWEREVGDAGGGVGGVGGSGGKLLTLWSQIEEDMALWLDKRLNPRPYGVNIDAAKVEMEAAASCADPDGLKRLPLEVWLGGDAQMRQLRDTLERERRDVLARLHELGLVNVGGKKDSGTSNSKPTSTSTSPGGVKVDADGDGAADLQKKNGTANGGHKNENNEEFILKVGDDTDVNMHDMNDDPDDDIETAEDDDDDEEEEEEEEEDGDLTDLDSDDDL